MNIHQRFRQLEKEAPSLATLINWHSEETQQIVAAYMNQLMSLDNFLKHPLSDPDSTEDDNEIAKQYFYKKVFIAPLFVLSKLFNDTEKINLILSLTKSSGLDEDLLKNYADYLEHIIAGPSEKVIPIFNQASYSSLEKMFENNEYILNNFVLNIDKTNVSNTLNGISEDAFLNIVKFMKKSEASKSRFKGSLTVLFGIALKRSFEVAIKEFDYNFTEEFIKLTQVLEKKGQKNFNNVELKSNLIYVLLDNQLEDMFAYTIKSYLDTYGDDENNKVSNSARTEMFKLLEEKKCFKHYFKLEDAIGKPNYATETPQGLINFMVNEGNYEDFCRIVTSKNRKSLGYFSDGLKSNPDHKIEESQLYYLALTSQKEKFKHLLNNLYTYENQTYQEYLSSTRQEKLTESHFEDIFNVIFKDELESFKIALQSQQEYSMLEALNEFEESYTKKKIKHATENKLQEERNKMNFFMRLNFFFTNLFKTKKEITNHKQQANQEVTEQQIFIRDLNANSMALNDKLNFLSKKVKINSPLSALHKDEVIENIKQIRAIASSIENMLEKEYSVKHVEAFVAYKNLTNKYFVNAVEKFIQANNEIKLQNLDRKENIAEFTQEFRDQVKLIKENLDNVREVISTSRKNDLLDEMKSDTTLLKMKASQ